MYCVEYSSIRPSGCVDWSRHTVTAPVSHGTYRGISKRKLDSETQKNNSSFRNRITRITHTTTPYCPHYYPHTPYYYSPDFIWSKGHPPAPQHLDLTHYIQQSQHNFLMISTQFPCPCCDLIQRLVHGADSVLDVHHITI